MMETKKYWESSKVGISTETLSVLNEYFLSLKLANKAEVTVIKYRWILERFFSECSIPLNELTSDVVRNWLNNFSQNKKARTIDLVLSALSSFFQFCLEEEHIEKMIIKKRWRPRIPQSLPKYLNEQEYVKVKISSENLSTRNRALVLFLFSSGCRSSEVSNLLIQDVDLERRTAEVTGKGKKIRKVHFSEECAFSLKEYLQTRSYQDKDPLFLSKTGKNLLPTGIYQMISKLGIKAGLTQPLFPHVCRHTFATNMLAREAGLTFLADEMGTHDINTTRVYVRLPTVAYQSKMG